MGTHEHGVCDASCSEGGRSSPLTGSCLDVSDDAREHCMQDGAHELHARCEQRRAKWRGILGLQALLRRGVVTHEELLHQAECQGGLACLRLQRSFRVLSRATGSLRLGWKCSQLGRQQRGHCGPAAEAVQKCCRKVCARFTRIGLQDGSKQLHLLSSGGEEEVQPINQQADSGRGEKGRDGASSSRCSHGLHLWADNHILLQAQQSSLNQEHQLLGDRRQTAIWQQHADARAGHPSGGCAAEACSHDDEHTQRALQRMLVAFCDPGKQHEQQMQGCLEQKWGGRHSERLPQGQRLGCRRDAQRRECLGGRRGFEARHGHSGLWRVLLGQACDCVQQSMMARAVRRRSGSRQELCHSLGQAAGKRGWSHHSAGSHPLDAHAHASRPEGKPGRAAHQPRQDERLGRAHPRVHGAMQRIDAESNGGTFLWPLH